MKRELKVGQLARGHALVGFELESHEERIESLQLLGELALSLRLKNLMKRELKVPSLSSALVIRGTLESHEERIERILCLGVWHEQKGKNLMKRELKGSR